MGSREEDLYAHCLMTFAMASVDCSWKDTSSELTNGALPISLVWKFGVIGSGSTSVYLSNSSKIKC